MSDAWHILIHRPSPPAVWVQTEGAAWSLPRFDPKPEDVPSPEALTRVLREEWGLQLYYLRRVHRRHDPAADRTDQVFAYELLEGDAPRLPDGRWVSREELDRLPPAADPVTGGAVHGWLHENTTGPIPPARSPWARTGWYAAARDWITTKLRERGVEGPVSVETVKSWSISCVWRVTAGDLVCYFKASHAMFAAETGLARFLSRRYPDHLPDLLAADVGRNWMLMSAFSDRPLGNEKEVEPWVETARLIGRIQRECEASAGDLLSLGCMDRPLPSLAAGLDRLLSERSLLRVGEAEGLSVENYGRLSALAPELKAALDRLDGYGLPLTLVHGDLHPYNVALHDSRLLVYDWSDGSVTHPFMDFLFLHRSYGGEDAAGVADRLRYAYLDAWTPLLPENELREAFELSQKLAPLYHALSYVWIADHAEPTAKGELDGGIPGFAHTLLEKWTPDEAA